MLALVAVPGPCCLGPARPRINLSTHAIDGEADHVRHVRIPRGALSGLTDMLHAPPGSSSSIQLQRHQAFPRIGLIGRHCGGLGHLIYSSSIPIKGFALTLSFNLIVEVTGQLMEINMPAL